MKKILSTTEITKHLGTRVTPTFLDASFILPEESYVLGKFLPWWTRHKKEIGLVFKEGIADCDDFSREFCGQLRIAARQLQGPHAICVAVLRVRNLTQSLGMGTGSHALNLVGLRSKNDVRWVVIEPQNNLFINLENYNTADNLRADF